MKTREEIEKEIALKRKLIEGYNVCIADNEKAIKAATVNKENLLKEITTLEWVLLEEPIAPFKKAKKSMFDEENEEDLEMYYEGSKKYETQAQRKI